MRRHSGEAHGDGSFASEHREVGYKLGEENQTLDSLCDKELARECILHVYMVYVHHTCMHTHTCTEALEVYECPDPVGRVAVSQSQ